MGFAKFNKKGEISTTFLITVVILVVSAFVLFTFLKGSVISSDVADKSVCHQSIVYRSTSLGPLKGSQAIPLRCKTQKICLTMSGDDCFELSSTKKNPVSKKRLSECKGEKCINVKEEIMEVLADSMISCHSMLGEGKLNFMSSDYLKVAPTVYGLICNRIAFDREAKKNIDSIGHGEFYSYLGKKTVFDEDSQSLVSALEYLYPGWKNSKDSVHLFKSFQEGEEVEEANEGDKGKIEGINFKEWSMNLNQDGGFAVIAMEAPSGQGKALLMGAGTAGAVVAVSVASVVFLPVGIIVGATILAIGGVGGTVAGGAVLWYNYNGKFDYAPPTIIPFDIKVLKSLGVSSFEIAP